MKMPSKNNICTVSDMRKDPQNLLRRVEREDILYVYNKSKIQAVMLSIDFFNNLNSQLEKLKDKVLKKVIG